MPYAEDSTGAGLGACMRWLFVTTVLLMFILYNQILIAYREGDSPANTPEP